LSDVELKAILMRIESLLERLRVEYYRDVAERLFYLESELLNLRRELRRLGEVIESLSSALPTQGGPLSVTETRDFVRKTWPKPPQIIQPSAKAEVGRPRARRKTTRGEAYRGVELTKEGVLRYLSTEANDTELKILKLLYENPDYGTRGSTEIARAIGKVREHTARTLKKLCDRGLLMREEGGIPFSYSMPREVAEAVKEYFEGRG